MIVLEKLEDLTKYYNAEENSYKFQESIQIKFDLKIESDLIVKGDINALNIDAWNIIAWDIIAKDIIAKDIDARDIITLNIDSWNIDAWNINAKDIDALNIIAWNIFANDINAVHIRYHDFAIAYNSFKCVSATARRKSGIALCLDQPIFYKDKENK